MDKISIVTSLYRSSKYVDDFYELHLKCIKKLGIDYEFVFVDDGYPDDSKEKVKKIIEKDKHVRLILFSRNFGQYPAMFAGMDHASGDYIYTCDCDLEESPENIIQLYEKITRKEDLDFVYGVVKERSGGLVRNVFGTLFFKIMKVIASIDIPKNMSWQIIMSKRYKEALMLYKEAETYPTGLMVLTGFNQESFPLEKKYKGSTVYSFSKRLNLAITSVTSFSSKPLIFIGMFGFFVVFIAFMSLLIVMIRKWFFHVDFQIGWISIVCSIWIVGGLILTSIGVIGIYISKIFNQVKNRPPYIIKSIIN